jgi:peroxiredoxin/YHS domain-containing protein
MKTTQIFKAAALAGVLGSTSAHAQVAGRPAVGKKPPLTCPVMKAPVRDTAHAPKLLVNNEPVYFCCAGCGPQLQKDPAKYLKTVKDPVTGKPFTVTAKSPKMEHGGALFVFSSAKTHETFHADPGKYLKHGSPQDKPGDKQDGEHGKHGTSHGAGAGHAPVRAAAGLAIGQKVPEFSVTDVRGKTWTLSDLQKSAPSGVVSLTFWCSFCHSCRHVEGRLDQFARTHRGKAAVVAVDASAGETAERVAAFAKEKGLTLPILLDAAGKTADLFGVSVTTTTVVIDRAGVLRYRGQFAGGRQAFAGEALQAVLAGKPVPQQETPLRG